MSEIKVGDRVTRGRHPDGRTVVAIDNGWAWCRYDDGGYVASLLLELTLVPQTITVTIPLDVARCVIGRRGSLSVYAALLKVQSIIEAELGRDDS